MNYIDFTTRYDLAPDLAFALIYKGEAWILDDDEALDGHLTIPRIRDIIDNELDADLFDLHLCDDDPDGVERRREETRLECLIEDNGEAYITIKKVQSPWTGRKGWRVTWRPALVTALKEDEIMCRLIDAALLDLQAVLNRQ